MTTSPYGICRSASATARWNGSRLVEIDLDVQEVVALAREEADEPLRERMRLVSREHPGSGQLVPEEKLALEHDLAHAPAFRCIGQLSGHA